MKKIILVSAAIMWALFVSAQKNCGTTQHLDYLKSQDPQLEQKMLQNEIILQNWINNQPEESTIITIPVVVHVVYNTSGKNIPFIESKTKELSTIKTLNLIFGLIFKLFILFKIARKLAQSEALNIIFKTHKPPTILWNLWVLLKHLSPLLALAT